MHAHDQAGMRQRAVRPGRVGDRADADRLSPGHPADPGRLLGLQRLVGNAAVGRIIAATPPAGASVQRDRGHDPAGEADRATVDAGLRGAGESLAPAVRADMEAVTGRDQSGVRIHRGAAADRAAKALGAHAFTTGSHIVFQRGRYDPTSTAGRRMLRHELKHVEQQSSGPVEGTDLGNGIRVSHPSDRHERAAVAAENAVPAQRTVAEAAHTTVDSAAVGGQTVPAQRIAVQRDVGFEFEAGSVHTSVYSTPITAEDRADPGRGAGPRWQPRPRGGAGDRMRAMRKKEGILTATGFTAEADEVTLGSDLEFVLAHVPETPAGRARLVAVLNNVVAIAARLSAGGLYQASDLQGVGGATVVGNPDGFAVMNSSGPLRAKPQMTAGLRLDRLDELMSYLANPREHNVAPPTVSDAVDGRERAFVDLNQMDFESRILNRSPEYVARALAAFRQQPDVPDDFGSPQLTGLLDLMVSYLLQGSSPRQLPYAKSVAPMLARTDLASIFASLPEAEREFLSQGDGERFVELVFAGGQFGGMVTEPGRPVLVGGAGLGVRPPDFSRVTRGLWVSQISQGIDIMTPDGYLLLEDVTAREAKPEDFESMGALEDKMEPVGSDALLAPILELRRMRDLTRLAEWPAVALAAFDLTVALNDGAALDYNRPAVVPDLPGVPPPPPPGPGPAPGPSRPTPGPSGTAPPKGKKPGVRDRLKKFIKK